MQGREAVPVGLSSRATGCPEIRHKITKGEIQRWTKAPDRLEDIVEKLLQRALENTTPEDKKAVDKYDINKLHESTIDKKLKSPSLKDAALLVYSDVHEQLKDVQTWTQREDMIRLLCLLWRTFLFLRNPHGGRKIHPLTHAACPESTSHGTGTAK